MTAAASSNEPTAAIEAAETIKGGKHRATRTRRLPALPSIPRRQKSTDPEVTKPAKAPKAKARKAVAATARVTPTGKAMFSVDSNGEARPNLGLVGANGFSTFAVSAGEALQKSSPGGFWVELFETPEQRSTRINVQAVAQTLILVGTGVAKIAAARKK